MYNMSTYTLYIKTLAQLTVLHIDKDYDLIANITAQPVERLTQN